MTLRPSRELIRSRPVAALASVCSVAALAAPAPAIAEGASSGSGGGIAKPTVVLVHGAFADASGWDGVVERLQRDGYPVIAPANPLRGLASDSAYIAGVLKSVKGPVILAGHSYGGAVIGEAAAGNRNVKALVYISAFMPDKGETLGALGAKFRGSRLNPALRQVPFQNGDGTTGTDLYIKPDTFRQVFAADLAASTAAQMSATQRPISASAFTEKADAAAWKTIPSWFLVATKDRAIAPDLERFEAKRAGSHTIEVNSSHVAMISHPGTVTSLILDAIRTEASGTPSLATTGGNASATGLIGVVAIVAGVGLIVAVRRHQARGR
ncbi:alpha/beta hydrolase [Streptomyces scopuliridis]|uniref:alpha/beta fold hydrolase n=1 Tax=Streptomyces scopuliridis TaxID=452529 RepID=UPI002DDB5DC7|nr:alpha/beta hydrolase [Streptomyces scopuliridis]WSB34755.1 alpha/beta hydrolase [Streptomyces scopuliridis]